MESVSGNGPFSFLQDCPEATEEMNMIRGEYDATFERLIRAHVALRLGAKEETGRLKSRRQAL